MLRGIARRLRGGEKGQDYLEFAIIVPIFMLLVMGIVDFGRVFNTWMMVTHGAREGARYAAVGYSEADVVAHVEATTAGLAVTVTVNPAAPADRNPGDPVTVSVSTNVQLFSGFIASLLVDNPFPVANFAEMRYEGPWI